MIEGELFALWNRVQSNYYINTVVEYSKNKNKTQIVTILCALYSLFLIPFTLFLSPEAVNPLIYSLFLCLILQLLVTFEKSLCNTEIRTSLHLDMCLFLIFHIIELLVVVQSLSEYTLVLLFVELSTRSYICYKKHNKSLTNENLYGIGLTIYYYVCILGQHSELIEYFLPNQALLINCYLFIKFAMQYILPQISISISMMLDLGENINTGIVVFNSYLTVEYINEKFSHLIKEFKSISAVGESPSYLIQTLISNCEKEKFDPDLPKEIIDYIVEDTTVIDDDIQIPELIDMDKLLLKLMEFKLYFSKFKRIMRSQFREGNLRFNSYDIYLMIAGKKYYFLVNEITDYQSVEEEIGCQGRILASIAHDFKTPLKAIENYCREISTSSIEESSNTSYDFLLKMVEYINSLKTSMDVVIKRDKKVHGLRSITSDTNKDSIDLKELCQFCIQLIQYFKRDNKNKENLNIILEYDETVPRSLKINEKCLKQILINLLSNAYKFTVSGYVKLIVKRVQKSVYFEVSDTGTGIARDEQIHLFSPFYQAPSNQAHNINGSGLGLYIVKEFVERLGSTLKYASELGQGSSFYFELEIANYIENSLDHDTILVETYDNLTPSLKNVLMNMNNNSNKNIKKVRLS